MIEKEPPCPHKSFAWHLGVVFLWSVALIVGACVFALIFGGCAPQPCRIVGRTAPPSHTQKARITYYTGHQTAAGPLPAQGVTIAAHPKYRFGTKVEIPMLYEYLGDKDYEVQDRGSAVTKMKASHGKADVIDIYVKNVRTMRWLEAVAPEYATISF